MSKDKRIFLINNEDYDVIEYNKSVNEINVSEKLNSVLEKIEVAFSKNLKSNRILSIECLDDENIEIMKPYIIDEHLEKLTQRYGVEKLEKIFSSGQSKEQINLIFNLLEDEILFLYDERYEIVVDRNDNEILYNIAYYLCNEQNNKKIDNLRYKTKYYMKKEALRLLLANEKFIQYRMTNPFESNNVLLLFLKNDIFDENSTYANIYEKIKLTEYCVKNFPNDLVSMLEYFLVNGKEMLPIYKEIYGFLDYYSENVSGLDYSVVLKIVKKCKKMGITSPKEIRKRLGFLNVNSLNKLINKA